MYFLFYDFNNGSSDYIACDSVEECDTAFRLMQDHSYKYTQHYIINAYCAFVPFTKDGEALIEHQEPIKGYDCKVR